jgi:hypothetical protein
VERGSNGRKPMPPVDPRMRGATLNLISMTENVRDLLACIPYRGS